MAEQKPVDGDTAPIMEAGWFPDPRNETRERLWDGNEWLDWSRPSKEGIPEANPAGWRPDPADSQLERLWAGDRWTAHSRVPPEVAAQGIIKVFDVHRETRQEDRLRELQLSAEWAQDAGVQGDDAREATNSEVLSAYTRLSPLIADFLEEELLGRRQPDRGSVSPEPFGQAFQTQLTESELGQPPGFAVAAASGPIRVVLRSGFVSCAIWQSQLRKVSPAFGVAPDAGRGNIEVRRAWLEHIPDEIELLRTDPDLAPWFWPVNGRAFTGLVASCGLLGIVESRYDPVSTEGITDGMMAVTGLVRTIEAYPGAEVLDPWLTYYAAAGWSLFLATTPLWSE